MRVYKTQGWNKADELTGLAGPVFAVAFNPDASRLAAAGYDGQVRLFDLKTRKLEKIFTPVPLGGR